MLTLDASSFPGILIMDAFSTTWMVVMDKWFVIRILVLEA